MGKGKIRKTMEEFKAGDLHSGSKDGPVVSNPKQAVAIALSQQKKADKGTGAHDPNDGPFQHVESVGMNNSDW